MPSVPQYLTFVQICLALFISFLQEVDQRLATLIAEAYAEEPLPVDPLDNVISDSDDDSRPPVATPSVSTNTVAPSTPRPLSAASTATSSQTTLAESPSRWRSQRTPNRELRAEFARTHICPHYWHETARPRLPECPVCHTAR
jgi:hypothetical protein